MTPVQSGLSITLALAATVLFTAVAHGRQTERTVAMDTTTLNKTIADLVIEQPGRSRIFEELGIDYCCGGRRPLRDALAAKNLEPADVLSRLAAADTSRQTVDSTDYAALSLTDLITHIVDTHHVYLRNELPRLNTLVDKVAQAHGDTPKGDDLRALQRTVRALAAELQAHLMKEEQVLFPNIQRLETDQPAMNIDAPIHVMMAEHDSAGEALATIRSLTDSFTLPEWGCNTYRAMLDALANLEQDLHQHIHKENNILFPRARTLADSRADS